MSATQQELDDAAIATALLLGVTITCGSTARDWLMHRGFYQNWDGTFTRWFTPPQNNNPTE